MKRTLAIGFVLAMLLFSLAGCGEKKDNGTTNGTTNDTTNGMENGNTADNGAADDMTGGSTKDDSVTGDGMMGDDMTGDTAGGTEDTVSSANRRGNAAARASDRSRYFGSDKTITRENGGVYGKSLTPEAGWNTNAQLRSNGRSMAGITVPSANDLRYRQMLSNGRVRDTDGFLFDGENTHYNTLR